MFGIELLITLLVSLMVGYLSVIVPLLVKLSELDKSAHRNTPIKKIIIAVTGACMLCASVVIILYLTDPVDPVGPLNIIVVQFITVVEAVVKAIWSFVLKELVPFNGRLFQVENFKAIYWFGYAELIVPIAIELCLIWTKTSKETKTKQAGQSDKDKVGTKFMLRVAYRFLVVVSLCFVFAWVNYLICFGLYRALIEFSVWHVFITSGLCNLIIDIIIMVAISS